MTTVIKVESLQVKNSVIHSKTDHTEAKERKRKTLNKKEHLSKNCRTKLKYDKL